jgi:hypothetical protein
LKRLLSCGIRNVLSGHKETVAVVYQLGINAVENACACADYTNILCTLRIY